MLERTSTSGKALFQCSGCKRVSATPDKHCSKTPDCTDGETKKNKENQMQKKTSKQTSAIDIVFAAEPGSPDLRFVEVKDGNGHSVAIGEWIDRDGYKVLRIQTGSQREEKGGE